MKIESLTANAETSAALLAARRGTAFFSHAIQDLDERDLDEPSAVDGWLRRDIVAYVGYHARRMSELVARAKNRDEGLEWHPPLGTEYLYRATLPVVALRNLDRHAAAHLDVEWRDLGADAWNRLASSAHGEVSLLELAWNRAQTVWFGGLLLRSTADERVVPRNVRAQPVIGAQLFAKPQNPTS